MTRSYILSLAMAAAASALLASGTAAKDPKTTAPRMDHVKPVEHSDSGADATTTHAQNAPPPTVIRGGAATSGNRTTSATAGRGKAKP